jgi:hypothetical protein
LYEYNLLHYLLEALKSSHKPSFRFAVASFPLPSFRFRVASFPFHHVTQPTVTQPTVTQPTVTQPTVTQPTVTQPTVSLLALLQLYISYADKKFTRMIIEHRLASKYF